MNTALSTEEFQEFFALEGIVARGMSVYAAKIPKLIKEEIASRKARQ